MSRGVVAVAAAVAIAGVVVFAMRGADEADTTEEARTAKEAGEPAAPGTSASRPERERPRLEAPRERRRAGADSETHLTPEGRVVRDHRAVKKGVPAQPARRPMPKRTPVERATLARVRLAVRPEVKRCVREHAAEVEDGQRLLATVYVTIAEGAGTASGIEIDGDVPAPIARCAQERLASLHVDLPEAADATAYPLRMPFDLAQLRD